MAKVDGFTIAFSHRGSWTADLLEPGSEVEVIPVAWRTDYDHSKKELFIWLKKSDDVITYMKRARFRVAIAFKKPDGSGSSENITGIFWVKPLQASGHPRQGILASVECRSKPGDRQ